MQKINMIFYSALFLLVVPGIGLNAAFGEKLIVSDGFENPAQFSALDKFTGTEIQLLSEGTIDVFIGSIDFDSDGFLIATDGEAEVVGIDAGFYQFSFIIEEGEPQLLETIIGSDFSGEGCSGLSFSPDNIMYCTNEDGLHVVDIDAGTVVQVGEYNIDESIGNSVAVSSDGTIYFANQIGLYTLDPVDATSTNLVNWDNNGDETIDEPHVTPGEDLEYGECVALSMDFDTAGNLYALMNCEDEPVLAKIVVNPITVNVGGEELANLELFFLERNEDLEVFELEEMEFTDALAISSFSFDFLLGNTYGVVLDGFESVTATIDENGNYITTDDTSEIKICDNATLVLDSGDEAYVDCNNTSISVESGTIDVTLEADDGKPPVTTSLIGGDSIVFDSENFTITNTSEENVIEVVFDGKLFEIQPGETLNLGVAIDHYLGYVAKTRHHHYDKDDEHGDDDNDDIKHKHNEKKLKYDHKKHDKITVKLSDQFTGEVNYELKKAKKLFNPVDKNNEGIESEESHLVGYDLKKIKGEPKFKGMKNIQVTNQFGDLTVDIKKVKGLLVPSAKDHFEIPDELDSIVINSFKCYDAKISKIDNKKPKFDDIIVSLADQFGSSNMKVVKPKALCSPVETNDQGILDEENYLMCYDLKKVKGEPKFKKNNVFTNNQFGSEEIKVKNPKTLCVPSEIALSE